MLFFSILVIQITDCTVYYIVEEWRVCRMNSHWKICIDLISQGKSWIAGRWAINGKLKYISAGYISNSTSYTVL